MGWLTPRQLYGLQSQRQAEPSVCTLTLPSSASARIVSSAFLRSSSGDAFTGEAASASLCLLPYLNWLGPSCRKTGPWEYLQAATGFYAFGTSGHPAMLGALPTKPCSRSSYDLTAAGLFLRVRLGILAERSAKHPPPLGCKARAAKPEDQTKAWSG